MSAGIIRYALARTPEGVIGRRSACYYLPQREGRQQIQRDAFPGEKVWRMTVEEASVEELNATEGVGPKDAGSVNGELLVALKLCRKECRIIGAMVPRSSSGEAAMRAATAADKAIARAESLEPQEESHES